MEKEKEKQRIKKMEEEKEKVDDNIKNIVFNYYMLNFLNYL